MYIEGIGRISQEKVLQIFTNEVKSALKMGTCQSINLELYIKRKW